MKYIKQGLSEGATLVCGGNEVNDKGYFIEPTIFTDVRGEMSIAKEEILAYFYALKSLAMNLLKLQREQIKQHMVCQAVFGQMIYRLVIKWLH